MEEKLFELMAQAEDLQTHAAKLQNEAQEVFSALPLAVEQAGQKIRSTGLQMALILFGICVVVCGASVAFIGWSTDSLREDRAALAAELETLKASIQTEKATLAEMKSKTWGLELMSYSDGGRGIILPKGTTFSHTAKIEKGRTAIVIKP